MTYLVNSYGLTVHIFNVLLHVIIFEITYMKCLNGFKETHKNI